MDMGLIKIGVNVDIKRTDGRIHSAVVSGVTEEAQSVTVEWFERGETKGKEIEVEAIYELNPELFPTNCKQEPQKNGVDRKQAVVSKETPRGVRLSSAQASRPHGLPLDGGRGGGGGEDLSPARRGVGDRSPPQGIDAMSPGRVSDQSPPRFNEFDSPAEREARKNSYQKKSQCVKEVERIKQRRADRRAAQVAVREQLEQEHDTSVPNWEFDAMIREFRKTLEYRPITSDDAIVDHQICVCVRKRPRNKRELDRKENDVVTVPSKDIVIVHEPKTKVDLTKFLENQTFRFDYAFDETSTNEMIYRYTAQPLVESTFTGGMATCFAYGQTGSGKTHTMGGDFASKGKQDCSKGIYILAAADVFRLNSTKYKKQDLVVGTSFFEIYSGKVFDLLNGKARLRVLEDGKQQVQVVGLREEEVSKVDDVLRLVQHGNNVRTSGVTSANNHSSRSHAVLQIILRKRGMRKIYGKFSLIDLAGNERGADTSSSDRQTRMEGAEINKSLLALKECIRALGRRGAHLPFRASKLTQVLRDSFIGENSRTCMIAMISPGMASCEHTLNTLRYADRVKELGPGGPVEGGRALDYGGGGGLVDAGGGGRVSDNAQPGLVQQKSDLALLRNANEEELPNDLYEFHEVINRMQEEEEGIIDEHRDVVEKNVKWAESAKKLLKMTDSVDFDVESYARQLDGLLANKIEVLVNLREKVVNFRKELQQEEFMSQKITSSK